MSEQSDSDIHRLIATLEAYIKTLSQNVDDHEKRIRQLERWMFMAIGAGGLLTGAVQYFR